MTDTPSNRIGRLHVITDFFFQQRIGADLLARYAIEGGADAIQFRQKHGPVRHRLAEAQRVAEVCKKSGCPLIIDDDIDIALGVEAEGVHLGQQDFPVGIARRILDNSIIIGATATTLSEARRAWNDGADYIGFGPVFPSKSKDKLASIKGVDGLAAVCAAVPIPVIAIAGITAEKIESVMQAGAYGVAILSAISGSPDPTAATREIAMEINRWLPSTSAAAS